MRIIYHRDRPVIRSASGELSLSMVVNREVGASSLSVWIANHGPGEVVPQNTHAVEEVLMFLVALRLLAILADADAQPGTPVDATSLTA